MKRVELLVLERDARAVTEGLGRMGLVHLSKAQAAEGGDLVQPTHLEDELARVHALLERVDTLCGALDIPEDHPPAEVAFVRAGELDKVLQPIEQQLDSIVQRRRKLDSEMETEYQVLRDLEAFRPVEAPPERLRELDFLHFAIGTLPGGEVDDVREEAGERAVLLPFRSPDGQQRLIALASRAGRFALQSILEEHGFQPERLPDLGGDTPAEVAGRTRQRLLELAKDQESLRAESRDLARSVGGQLAAYRQRLRVEEQLLEAQAYFGHTASTCLISGYVPTERVDALRAELLRLTDGRVVVEVEDPPQGDLQTPTMMQNPRLLRPFERLVAGYGTPGYSEVEPTPLVAVSFLLMFGAMFGDVGHGLVLVAAGLAVRQRATKPLVRDGATLLWMAGASAVAFGWVYGSVFGVEGALAPPVGGWFEPMAGGNVRRLLMAAVGLGAVVIALGVVLNIINRVRAGDYFAMVVDRFGLVGLVFYAGVLGLAVRSLAVGGVAPRAWEVAVFVVLPLVVLFLREPLHMLMTRRDRPPAASLLGGLFRGFVDILETVTAYVANTVSFVRVGAFALAHAAVCVAIFATERIVAQMPGGPVWSVLVVGGGNAFVIVLEGLVVSIQAVRLEYYEFFSKFFRGEGKAYRPFKLS
ncbi:MAG: V-type ATP synthase subunit I [Candidatus Brocadiia bacterium]